MKHHMDDFYDMETIKMEKGAEIIIVAVGVLTIMSLFLL